jgi:hypothetical protein
MNDGILIDKSTLTPVDSGHGSISIRVVVLEKKLTSSARNADELPLDIEADELLPETDSRPTSTFLEQPGKRGQFCCVFLINGQRQHALNNQFIVRDLELKYLRNRMIVVVDCDQLKPQAIAHLMQGSRHGFFEGNVYSDVENRLIATLKGDPDLRRLEEEAEDDISSLEAGDEAVKAALDQLIESHHEASTHIGLGASQAGLSVGISRDGGVLINQPVVGESENPNEPSTAYPILKMNPDIATIRIKPDEERRFMLSPVPESSWKSVETLTVTVDPPIKELQISRTTQAIGEEVKLLFVEPEDFEEDEYPIETTFRALAFFQNIDEPRMVERRLIINRPRKSPPKPPEPLVDEPTYLKVTSRQPIKLVAGGPDVHVKLRWNGKDELMTGGMPRWTMSATCESPSEEPISFLTLPSSGRFELLIRTSHGLNIGDQLKFDIEAAGPGRSLSTAFLADVVESPQPRRSTKAIVSGAQRRPPYALIYIRKENWNDETCWGENWTSADSGSYEAPSQKSPLTIFINQDMELLAVYREQLITKKLEEKTVLQRINRYTAHVAFHLYQMYERNKELENQADAVVDAQTDEQKREEIQRVAKTLLKLMQVTQ